MITAILNSYKRPKNLNEQIIALQNQTIPAREIMIWHNHPGDDLPMNYEVSKFTKSAYNNFNYGVWARFAFALNAQTEYICIFDDDTIPGSRWFENCLGQMRKQEALLGTIGILYTDPPEPMAPSASYYNNFIRIGWDELGNREESVEVDFVGHAWFFKREWLTAFWRELPSPEFNLCGEDMHFSYMLQKHLGIPTIVPPHPKNQRDLWGSVRGNELGNDDASLWISNIKDSNGRPFRKSMDNFFLVQRRKGWRLVNDK